MSTKTGTWYGGLSPHHPFQESSFHGPLTGPNILRPKIQAPTFSNERAAKSLSMPVVPASVLYIFLKTSVLKNQEKISGPRTPSGLSRSCLGPAPNPSIEIENAATLTLLIEPFLKLQFYSC